MLFVRTPTPPPQAHSENSEPISRVRNTYLAPPRMSFRLMLTTNMQPSNPKLLDHSQIAYWYPLRVPRDLNAAFCVALVLTVKVDVASAFTDKGLKWQTVLAGNPPQLRLIALENDAPEDGTDMV